MVELLAPAGSYESLCAAVNAGADAVYIGGSMFGARAYADNPDEELLIKGIEYCHLHGRKLYMTVNTLLKEQELMTKLFPFLLPYYEHGLDGIIVQDLGVVKFVHAHFPGLEVHASTQMTVTSAEGAALLKEMGITRVVPARELSLSEIRSIIEETGLEVETFIHGAMCYCYSGQCLMSSMIGGRSGNRGRCAQPCRLPYQLEAEHKKNIPPYLLSMKDMCTLDLIPDILDAGIASLKIEGRMKRPEYTAGVVSIYRKYIDLYLEKGRKGFRVQEEDRLILLDLYNRGGFSDGYYRKHNGQDMMAMIRPNHLGTQAAKVIAAGKGKVRAKALEVLGKNDVLEFSTSAETTLGMAVKKGIEFTVSCPGSAPKAGSVIYRTRNDSLLQDLEKRYISESCKENIKGTLMIFEGSPAILKLTWNDINVTVSGMCAQAAQNNPATEDAVRKQMMKTGNTPFVFEELEIELHGDLFVPVRELNALRRDGLEKLEQEILNRFKRTRVSYEADSEMREKPVCSAYKDINVNVLVTTAEQMETVLSFVEITPDTLYLDSMLFADIKDRKQESAILEKLIQSAKERGIRCFFYCPPVLRQKDRSFFEKEHVQSLFSKMDGFMVHTVDQLAWFKEVQERYPDTELAADSSLYAYNRTASAVLDELGIKRRTLPAELNSKELARLDTVGTELEIYGYQPLMQSAQCVQKNTLGCTGRPNILYIKDRKKTSFPVLNRCYVCCNTIFNSVPLNLFGSWTEIRQLHTDAVRLSFTIESAAETKSVLRMYMQAAQGKETAAADSTRGHFKRGVE